MTAVPSEAERARGTLKAGILVFRWGALAWMISLALTAGEPFSRPELAWAAIGGAIVWTAWLTVRRHDPSVPSLGFDLAIAAALVVISGLVVGEREILTRSFFATAYPLAAAISLGASRGVGVGLLGGVILGGALALSRAVNGLPLNVLDAADVQSLVNGSMAYLLGGVAAGVVSRLLDRSAAQFRELNEAAMRDRERAGRLAERETLAREIHDSVLQTLALVHKRGRELAAETTVQPAAVAKLATLAGQQERVLRALILREPSDPPEGRASLRELLEGVAREVQSPPVEMTAVGAVWLPRHTAEELAAAVKEALANVVEHASARRVSVFAEEVDGEVAVSVRDDGSGFALDEDALREAGKAGILKSMRGRVEDLGGSLRIESSPGKGTEVEMRVPVRSDG